MTLPAQSVRTQLAEAYYSANEDCWRAHEAMEDAIKTLVRAGCDSSLIQAFDAALPPLRRLAERSDELAGFHMEATHGA